MTVSYAPNSPNSRLWNWKLVLEYIHHPDYNLFPLRKLDSDAHHKLCLFEVQNRHFQLGEWFQPVLLPPPKLSEPLQYGVEYIVVKRRSLNPTPTIASRVWKDVKLAGQTWFLKDGDGKRVKYQYSDAGAVLFRYDDLWVRGMVYVEFDGYGVHFGYVLELTPARLAWVYDLQKDYWSNQ